MCPGIRPEGSGLGVLPTPLMVLSAGCMRSTLLSFAPNTSFLLLALQKWQLRFFFVVVFFLVFCSEFAPAMQAVIFRPV